MECGCYTVATQIRMMLFSDNQASIRLETMCERERIRDYMRERGREKTQERENEEL